MITFMEHLVSIFSLSLTEMIACLIHFCTTSQAMRNVGMKVIHRSTWSPGVSRLVQRNLQCGRLRFLTKVTNRKPYGTKQFCRTGAVVHSGLRSCWSSAAEPDAKAFSLRQWEACAVKRLIYCLPKRLKQMMNEIRDEFALILIRYM